MKNDIFYDSSPFLNIRCDLEIVKNSEIKLSTEAVELSA